MIVLIHDSKRNNQKLDDRMGWLCHVVASKESNGRYVIVKNRFKETEIERKYMNSKKYTQKSYSAEELAEYIRGLEEELGSKV